MTNEERNEILEEIAQILELTDYKHLPPLPIPENIKEMIRQSPEAAFAGFIITMKHMMAADVRTLKSKEEKQFLFGKKKKGKDRDVQIFEAQYTNDPTLE